MIKSIALTALSLSLAVGATAAVNTRIVLAEERMAHEEEGRIITSPIGGVENHFWYDYRVNILESQKELARDLREASKTKDMRNAWDEYRGELSHERGHYVHVMAKRGYHAPSVEVID
ncbi:MAG: hypothetical protein J7485_12255 [Sphingobium sp.]|nr:hypothetical protein [Sphingobium sp.]